MFSCVIRSSLVISQARLATRLTTAAQPAISCSRLDQQKHVSSCTSSQFVQPRRFQSSYALQFEKFGDPPSVLKLVETTSTVFGRKPADNEVLVQFLACPINPSDINVIQGTYMLKPSTFPAIPGNEGCARVIAVGPKCKQLQFGDLVIPAKSGFGTWRTHALASEIEFMKVDSKLDKFGASQLSVNPCTAYRMLKDFCNLKPGDCIIQNGANSAVGRNVIQLARLWNLRTINIIRERSNKQEMQALIDDLTSLGASIIFTDKEIASMEVMNARFNNQEFPRAKLALNMVGGDVTANMYKFLENGSPIVTYGGMSRKPVYMSTAGFIFRDLKLFGFWMTEWHKRNQASSERQKMFNYISKAIIDGNLQVTKPVPFELAKFQEAIAVSRMDHIIGKVTFVNRDI